MNCKIIECATLALMLLLPAAASHAAESKAAAPAQANATGNSEKGAKGAKPAAKIKLVDINSASKSELKTLPGIGDAQAEKIIAGRPYLSKANLTTHNIVSREIYEGLKSRVIARPNEATEAKLRELQKQPEKQKGR